ncbi:formylglycine-generating enzyme family protein [Sphingobacterium alkalisoli]|nr:SUMF1/EgtB/PvdO family nonheme iron enzyme [Sphingobacterium alkalisoli]
MKRLFFLLLTFAIAIDAYGQNTVAKLKYEDAEKAFYNGDYQSCISLLDETEELLGKSAPNILHLRIMSESKVWEADPYASYEQLETLRKLCDQYLKNYDIAGLEEKYRQIYDMAAGLPKVSTREEFAQLTETYKKETIAKHKEKLISENNLVFVEGGTYMMGEGKDAHEVTVSDFYIGKYEVTNRLYGNFKKNDGVGDVPVWPIAWDEAMGYCKWLEKQYGGTWRLPTEAEWEYAARGGNKSQGYKYSGSNDLDEVGKPLKSDVMGKYSLSPVGQHKSNELGIYDMTGNAREVCLDWYDKKYYTVSPKENPMGPDSGKERVVRGGSYWAALSSVYYRMKAGSPKKNWDAYNSYKVGFRVVYIPD